MVISRVRYPWLSIRSYMGRVFSCSHFYSMRCETGIITLKKLWDLTSADFNKEKEVAIWMGIRSVRTMAHHLCQWRTVLSKDNIDLIHNFCNGFISPDNNDPHQPSRSQQIFKNAQVPSRNGKSHACKTKPSFRESLIETLCQIF